MKTRYFKNPAAIWRIAEDASHVRLVNDHHWTDSVSGIEDMTNKQEIPASEGEPAAVQPEVTA